MRRRQFLILTSGASSIMSSTPVAADSSGPQLASYYERHMALRAGVAYGWSGSGAPVRLLAGGLAGALAGEPPGVRQVGVSEEAFFALLDGGQLVSWGRDSSAATPIMSGVAAFASGQSGWFAIDPAGVLWQGGGSRTAPRRVADDVLTACIGDSADYFIRRDGTLWVQGLAHRGQYGDGLLTATPGFISTARDAVAVKAHTGHAIYLNRGGAVMGTGGNRFGPLGAHGLGDKADRWGPVFDGARAIATGSRHSAAIRTDGTLWAWGEGFGVQPRQIFADVSAVAAGNTATIALAADGTLLQWDAGQGPRRLLLG